MNRTFDGWRLTEIANDPLVRKVLGGSGPIDLCPAAEDVNNFTFMDGDVGGWMLIPLYDGAYEAHTIFGYKANARRIVHRQQVAIDYMFIQTECEVILTKVADNNPGAKWLADRAGFVTDGYRKDAWAPGVGVSYLKLSLDRWRGLCSTLGKQGRAFHDFLEREKIKAGSESPVHPPDEYHDRAVGAAVEMIRAGNTIKGVNTYNRWAIFAGYAQIKLLSERPVVIDIHDAVLGLIDGNLEVLQCP